MKKIYILFFWLFTNLIHATGGYDNGSAVGKGNLQLDFTWNPGDVIDYGQSYITWNYGLTDTLAFHGYGSHEAKGTNQIYYGLKYTFLQNDSWDLSTAIGFRNREGETHIYAPQLLYTYKLPNDYDIGGSILDVYDITDSENLGVTFDIAFRIPFKLSFLQNHVESTKLALGAFRNASGKTYPTYSIDVKF
ncbi:MAG: Unknown protein [uncultured Sulfurovum sp.]|uniref:Uncharacterized protein n=1 Tax=uncultured Sulfurovum sp. TaxID=269237 RepID=A0A6S6SGN8_9BACT|nr:MAG: Unknown protein [uncultured Sulfurovum sp.]